MYMGYWDKAENKPKRFPNRDKEKEFYAKFLAKEPGFYDDAKWWEVVEEASCPPVEPLSICEVCGAQNLTESEVCSVCGAVLKGKDCINPACSKLIPLSAVVCPICGISQVPKVESPWTCGICGAKNPAGTTVCKKCSQEKGKVNPLAEEELIVNSIKDDELSISDMRVSLCNGSKANPINVTTYHSTAVIASPLTGERYPIIVYKKPNILDIVVDDTHPIFLSCGTSIVELISSEIAAYIFDVYRNLSSNPAHSISNLTWQIMEKYWLEKVEISLENIEKKSDILLTTIKNHISLHLNEKQADRLFNELTDIDQKLLLNEMLKHRIPMGQISELKSSGAFIRFAPDEFILRVFDEMPELFFNGNIWTTEYGVEVNLFGNNILEDVYKHTLKRYRNNLEAIIIFAAKKTKESSELKRVNAILDALYSDLSEDLS